MVTIEALPPDPSPDRTWPGLSMLTGGKGYVSAPLGQLHYRDVGPRDGRPPVLLFHQSPLTMVEFGAVQNSLAALGVRSIAVDTPGYGLSDQPSVLPTIGGLADNMLALLDHLGLESVVAAGHHTGACIATALSARHPQRVAAVILHGCPLYAEAEARAFRAHEEWDRAPRRDGGHLSFLFNDPEVEPLMSDEALSTWTWMAVTMFLQGPDIGHWAVNRYAMAADLTKIAGPGLVITDLADPIQYMDERALRLRPDFERAVLSTSGLHALMTDPARWAALAEDFLRRKVW